jgi:hypothetical protein
MIELSLYMPQITAAVRGGGPSNAFEVASYRRTREAFAFRASRGDLDWESRKELTLTNSFTRWIGIRR